jgi:hypothetical protein
MQVSLVFLTNLNHSHHLSTLHIREWKDPEMSCDLVCRLDSMFSCKCWQQSNDLWLCEFANYGMEYRDPQTCLFNTKSTLRWGICLCMYHFFCKSDSLFSHCCTLHNVNKRIAF